MTTAPNLTRITPDAASNDKEPLFPAAPAAETKFTISVQMEGFPVSVEFTGNGQKLKKVIAGLKAAGATPPPVRSFGGGGFGGKKIEPLTEPAYDAHGNEICPVHRVKVRPYTLNNGQSFKGCPSKSTGAEGEKVNDRGYCSLRFK